MNSVVNSPTGSSHEVPSPNGTSDGMQSSEMNRLPTVKAVEVLFQVSHLFLTEGKTEYILRVARSVGLSDCQSVTTIPEILNVGVGASYGSSWVGGDGRGAFSAVVLITEDEEQV